MSINQRETKRNIVCINRFSIVVLFFKVLSQHCFQLYQMKVDLQIQDLSLNLCVGYYKDGLPNYEYKIFEKYTNKILGVCKPRDIICIFQICVFFIQQMVVRITPKIKLFSLQSKSVFNYYHQLHPKVCAILLIDIQKSELYITPLI